VLIRPEDRINLENAPLKYKWRFMQRHKEETRDLIAISSLTKNSDEVDHLQSYLQKCLEKATPVSI